MSQKTLSSCALEVLLQISLFDLQAKYPRNVQQGKPHNHNTLNAQLNTTDTNMSYRFRAENMLPGLHPAASSTDTLMILVLIPHACCLTYCDSLYIIPGSADQCSSGNAYLDLIYSLNDLSPFFFNKHI